MNVSRKLRLCIFLPSALTLLLFVSGATVRAQTSTPGPQASSQTSPADGLHVSITPYIWFAGVSGTSGVLGHDAAVHASFGDIFNDLNIGAMGVIETCYNRVLMPVDFLWMKLSDDKGAPVNDLGVQSIKAKMTETMLAPRIGYRVVDGQRVKVDALFGIRYWHVSTDLTLQPNQGLGGFSASANWVDAIAGGGNPGFSDPESVRSNCWRRRRRLCPLRLPDRGFPRVPGEPQMRPDSGI
jgi:hypothetical protein